MKRRTHLLPTACVAVALAVCAGAPSAAQYNTPGNPIPPRHSPDKDEFQDKIAASPWKVGSLVLSPWAGLRDFRLVTDLGNRRTTGEDLTVTVGAGLRGYLPAGSKALFAVHALPEYVWWQDNEDKRQLNGRYGLGLFVFFNRLDLEFSQRRIEQQGFFSSELQLLTSSRSDLSTARAEVEVSPNVSLFGIASLQDYQNEEDENATFASLDRTDESALIGVRFKNPQGWTFELGYAASASDFVEGARDLSNSGDSQLFSIGFNRPRIELRLGLAFQNREADEGSEFGVFDQTTGDLAALWRTSQNVDVLAYTRRSQAYATDRRYTYRLEDRQGARVNFELDTVTLGLFGEVGEDDYELASGTVSSRLDDVTSYGADFGVALRQVTFGVRAYRTDYDSSLDEFDRDVTSVQFSLELAALSRFTSKLIDKLSLGSSGTSW